eukprot:Rmarinus@m.24588
MQTIEKLKETEGNRKRSASCESVSSYKSRSRAQSGHGDGWHLSAMQDEAEALFKKLHISSPDEDVKTHDLLELFEEHGILPDDPRVKTPMETLEDADTITGHELMDIIEAHDVLDRALSHKLTIPDFQAFCKEIDEIFEATVNCKGGKNADYIPQLSEEFVDPNQYGVAVCTVTGQRYAVGDSNATFCIQSCSKPITYALGLNEQGREKVHQHVGKEPSGRRFNETVLDKLNRPHNPCINAGAIMSCSLVEPNMCMSDRWDHVIECWEQLAGGRKPGFANSVYLSESATADRNYCLAYMMKEKGTFPEWIDSSHAMAKVLEFYFMCCAIELDAEGMAIVAATLANGGVNPVTQRRVLDAVTVQDTLSIMSSCGMYDYSGEFAFRIGLPAKSGVGGCIFVIVPGVLGLATFSPPLSEDGNSYRGVEFCKLLERRFAFHAFDNVDMSGKIDPRLKDEPSELENLNVMLYAAADGDIMGVRRMLARGIAINAQDADGRSALHLAASEGRLETVKYLVEHGALISLPDRYEGTPLDDAIRHNHIEVAKYLEKAEQREAHDPADPCQAAFIAMDTGGTNTVNLKELLGVLNRAGLRSDDPRVKIAFGNKHKLPAELPYSVFSSIFEKLPKLQKCASGNLTVPDFVSFSAKVRTVFESVRANTSGENANYIPGLAKVNPELQGLGICTVDGQRLTLGDAKKPVTAQAIANVITYLLAVNMHGDTKVHSMVGFEPSGSRYNDLTLNYSNRPHNPFINSGGIMCAALIKPKQTLDARFDALAGFWRKLQGGQRPGFNNSIFLSEMDHSDRNMCIAYLMRDEGCFGEDIVSDAEDLEDIIRFYYQACSVEVTCDSLAVVAATLANGGVCPLTGEQLMAPATVRNCLSLMFHCGMADYAGEWGFEIGFPAKNSASGLTMAVIPGVMGIVFFSPRLDHMRGDSSARAVEFFAKLGKLYRLHRYSNLPGAEHTHDSFDPCAQTRDETSMDIFEATHAAARGDIERLKCLHAASVDLSLGDYDGRTPLHLAASGGNTTCVKYLLRLNVDVNRRDRWGKTPYDDAVVEDLHDIATLLAVHGAKPGDVIRGKELQGEETEKSKEEESAANAPETTSKEAQKEKKKKSKSRWGL